MVSTEVVPLVELVDVVVDRNGVSILDLDRLIISDRENTAIFGPNGSGKSTLLKLLMKFFYPSACDGRAGLIRILGREEWSVWELRKRLGFVSSEIDHHFTVGRSGRLTPLDAVLTGFESSELPLDPEQVSPERKQKASEWLDFFEISTATRKHVAWMSTGERRRVMLARALVHGATSLLLDEPTAGLDLMAREKLLRLFEELAQAGIQLVLVTHHLEEIVPQISRCIMLQNGKVFWDGSIRDGLTSQRLSDLFDCKIEVSRTGQRLSANLTDLG